MRIAVIGASGDGFKKGSVMQDVAGLLRARGAVFEFIHAGESAVDLASLRPGHDLYVLKSSAEPALCFASALHVSGANILNPYPTVAAMKDKVVTAKILQEAGVPAPESFIAADAAQLASFLDDGPLVVKPYWAGSKGRGVSVIHSREQLSEVSSEGGIIYAQRYHQPDGRDHKLYCIGEEVLGVMRVWPARTYEDKLGQPFAVSDEMRDIALRCGRAFGVEVFGVDVILSNGSPYVVDVNSFPGFKGAPGAAKLLADYIYAEAEKTVRAKAPASNAGNQRSN
jgi:ribosomal protein S6--L-glutamate ligase